MTALMLLAGGCTGVSIAAVRAAWWLASAPVAARPRVDLWADLADEAATERRAA